MTQDHKWIAKYNEVKRFTSLRLISGIHLTGTGVTWPLEIKLIRNTKTQRNKVFLAHTDLTENRLTTD